MAWWWFLVTVWVVHGTLGSPEDLYDKELHDDVLDPETCSRHLDEMSNFQFYDPSFRVPQGVLQLNMVNFGNYHQCLNIREEISSSDYIEGKHCMLNPSEIRISSPISGASGGVRHRVVNIPNVDIPWMNGERLPANVTVTEKFIRQYRAVRTGVNLLAGQRSGLSTEVSIPFQLGLCIPKSCSIQQVLDPYLDNLLVSSNVTGRCRLPGDKPWVPGDYVAIAIFSLIGLLTISSTSYELYHIFVKKDASKINEFLACGSVYRNTAKLFTFRAIPGALDCIDGIRSMSILWVIYGHTLIKIALAMITNLLESLEWWDSVNGIMINAANISVDTFFMLSGLLLAYSSVPKMTKVTLFKNLHFFYLNRLLRMFPLLATAVLLQATLLHHIGDGANWLVESEQVIFCRKHWWSALLHVQNLVNPIDECLPHTWYLSVDIQLHILSPLVLFWILGKRRAAWIGLAACVLASFTASTVYCFLKNLATNMFVADPRGEEYYRYFYVNPLTRAPVFLVGIFYGYLLHVLRNKKLVLSKITAILSWVGMLAIFTLVLYTFYAVTRSDFNDQLLSNLTNSFKRPLWAIGVGWLIVACVHGYGGPINWFLTLTVWKFIARISYAMYIFHYPLQFVASASATTTTYFSTRVLMLSFLSDVALTVMVSAVAQVVIDAPCATLIRRMFGGSKKPRQPTKPVPTAPEQDKIGGSKPKSLEATSLEVPAIILPDPEKHLETPVKENLHFDGVNDGPGPAIEAKSRL